ncbi:accelerated cell death 11-like [Salvia divinorum]|uniref:Accelerated cell death 11-like n=1 Tax=Salvia divinorum TaxID=28513 RepID=A0ABD1I0B8_SALDI
MEEDRPLQKMAEAFKKLSNELNQFPEGEEARLEVAAFANACSLLSSDVSAALSYLLRSNMFPKWTILWRHQNQYLCCRILFEQINSSDGNSIKDPALEAYSVFTSYHGFAIRKDVTAGMFDAFPTKAELLIKLNEDETSSRIQMQNFIFSAAQVNKYIDQLLISRGLGTDW